MRRNDDRFDEVSILNLKRFAFVLTIHTETPTKTVQPNSRPPLQHSTILLAGVASYLTYLVRPRAIDREVYPTDIQSWLVQGTVQVPRGSPKRTSGAAMTPQNQNYTSHKQLCPATTQRFPSWARLRRWKRKRSPLQPLQLVRSICAPAEPSIQMWSQWVTVV